MMMNGMMGGMVWGASLGTVLLLGFAYIVWILSSKESGALKTIGQVIAIIIAVLAVLILLYGGIYGGRVGEGMAKQHKMMMEPGMSQH